MKLFKILILTFIILIIGNITFADDVNEDEAIILEVVDRSDGLSNLAVSSIVQDKYGFLWFGSQGGLNRYDGREMIIYRNDPFDQNGLIDNLIQTMYYDYDNHELWLGTYQGISRFIIKENRFINYSPEQYDFINPIIVSIEKDKNGQIWIGTLGGLDKFNPETEEIKHYVIPNDVVRDLYFTEDGTLYIGTYDGLYYISEDSSDIKKYDVELPSDYIMVIDEYQEGILTLGLWDGGIVSLDYNQNTYDTIDFPDNRVYTQLMIEDELWVGTWGGGLYKYSDKYISKISDGEHPVFDHSIIYSLFKDDTGIVWIGTNGNGVFKYNPRKKNYNKFKNDGSIDSLASGRVNVIFEDHLNQIWISVYGQELNVYNPQKQRMTKYTVQDDLVDDAITALVEVDDKMLIGTGDGLNWYDFKTKAFSHWNLLKKGTLVYSLEYAENILWIGTYSEGLYQYDFDSKVLLKFDTENSSLSDETIYDIHKDSSDRIWIGTNNGLNLIEDNQIKVFYKDENNRLSLPSNSINVIYEDNLKNIWIGTSGGGLARYDEEGFFTVYTEKDGMSSNEVVGILQDSYGRIWASTSDGMSLVDPISGDILIYTPDDGIGGYEFNRGSLKGSDGFLYFGGNHGITVLPSDFVSESRKAPEIYVTQMNLQGEPLLDVLFYNDETVRLKSNGGILSIKFSALDYDDPEKIIYSFRLVGYDDNWIGSKLKQEVLYNHLPPGKYTFQVYAETSKKLVSEIVEIDIVITAPWYNSYYAYIVYVFIILILLFLVFRLREGIVVKRKNTELSVLNRKLEVMNHELESLSITDALTGLYNRRYFKMEFQEEIQLAARSSNYLSIMMVDLDDFKFYNDTYGHVIGDALLIDLGNRLQDSLPRKTDFIARIGGDEFAIVLYDTKQEGAIVLAERLIETVKDISVTTESGEHTEHVDISIGIYSFIPNNYTTVTESLKRADSALYEAKEAGKNQYKIYK